MGRCGLIPQAVVAGLVALPLSVAAQAPEFDADPFGDADFHEVPLILGNNHPTAGRGEVAVMFSNSIIDRYTSQAGLAVDFNLHFSETFGVAFTGALLHGSLTSIVAGENGVLGEKVKTRQQESDPQGGDLTPRLPDFHQVTSYATAALLWSPLYGKVSIVSEIDLSLQLYAFFGLGINGLRKPDVQRSNNRRGYVVRNADFGDDGFFTDLRAHASVGAGVRVFLLDWLSLRVEFRTLSFIEEFDFTGNGQSSSYLASVYFAQFGLAAVVF